MKALFVVNGLGLGNSTRSYAIIRQLHRLGFLIHVATSGNGLEFFRGRPEVSSLLPLRALEYSHDANGRLQPLRTALRAIGAPRQAWANGAALMRYIRETRVSTVVYDSCYSPLPLLSSKAAFFAINNSASLMREFLRRGGVPWPAMGQLACVELPDMLFHALAPLKLIAPSLLAPRSRAEVGLIVRPEFETPPPRRTQVGRIAVMVSGSQLASPLEPRDWQLPIPVDVLGREGSSGENLRYHGRFADSGRILREADLLVINAGFSAISEAIALRRPCVVVPIADHAEQYLNARRVERLGIGRMATVATTRRAIAEVIAQYPAYSAVFDRLSIDTGGARRAALRIQEGSVRATR